MRRWIGIGLMGVLLACGRMGIAARAQAIKPPVVQGGTGQTGAGQTGGAKPALWKMKGAKGTVYLFGSIHVMKKEIDWETSKVRAAVAASDTLYLEIADIDDASMQAAQPEMMQLGMDAEHPLSTKISKADVALLDKALKGMGMPGEEAVEPMKPWAVYLTLSVLPAMQAGYDLQSGVDKTLPAEWKESGRVTKGFETVSEQMHFVADMPENLQVEMLHQTLVDLPKAVSEINTMVGDWTRGDVEAIARLENDEMKVKYPALYTELLVKRNERFADTLAGILKDPATGTVFVTIGAAHLAGPDSVMRMLEKKGFKAERVE